MRKLLTTLAVLTMIAAPVQASPINKDFAVDQAKAFCILAQGEDPAHLAMGGSFGMTMTMYDYKQPWEGDLFEDPEEYERNSNAYKNHFLWATDNLCPRESLELRQWVNNQL